MEKKLRIHIQYKITYSIAMANQFNQSINQSVVV